MKKTSYFLIFALITTVIFSSCKTKKKIVDNNSNKIIKVDSTPVKPVEEIVVKPRYDKDKMKKELEFMLNDKQRANSMENKRKLDSIAALNPDELELKDLITKTNNNLTQLVNLESTQTKLNTMMQNIADAAVANNIELANKNITEVLTYFANETTPVLPKIGQSYEKPTTIKEYLHLIKDRKIYNKKIENMVLDENGKIKELTLNKK